ncbi:hypothetical protein [Aliarcobacter butzleri]|uniref:hypothetical protein n=1 Tax=Aliarcobacter butzleri TaxID=28197 RepID=UPI00215A1C67|nr:hypothetical protein [Aliarcobacter butzleri]MCR8709972.1 hypothetical protein [Aliarcobacter butzleri]
MENSYLIKGSEKLLNEVQKYVKDNDLISIIDYSKAHKDLSLNAPTPQDAIVLWELITVCANLGGAISFLDFIKQSLTNENKKDNRTSITVTSRCGTYIQISSSTKDVEIHEFAKKTIIKVY